VNHADHAGGAGEGLRFAVREGGHTSRRAVAEIIE